jgi:glucose/arabinose dehydrogenase
MVWLNRRARASARIATACAVALTVTACAGGGEDGSEATPTQTESATVVGPTISPPRQIGGNPDATVVEQGRLVAGLDSPWDLEFLDGGAVLVSERDSGLIKRVSAGIATVLNGPGTEEITSTLDSSGEGGLLGLTLHPEDSSLLYAYYTRDDGNAVMRFTLRGDVLGDPTEVITGIPKASNHDGGRIDFGPDGYLYIATGDAAEPALAQDLGSLSGKILRVVADGTEADGSRAPDNPFDSRVWSYGHRNVQGFDWVADGRMYASEFGQSTLDEVNLIEPGRNYGWPQVEGTDGAPSGTSLGDTVEGLTYPVVEWATTEASPSGVAITHEGIYVAALRGERIWRIPLTEDGIGQPHVLLDDLGRVRHIERGPDGALYALTNNTDGRGDPGELDDRIVRLVVE